MSKSSKKNGKTENEKVKTPGEKIEDAVGIVKGGRLIALEGTRGKDLQEAALRLARLAADGDEPAGFSRFDASNTFYELSMGKARKYMPTPRTLILLYVSDLLFRLRWEVRPALEEGRTVIVAPYIETAIGFGLATGLPKEWLRELFSFVPTPETVYRLKEKVKNKAKREKAADGYLEFCADCLAVSSPDWTLAGLRRGILDHFDDLEEKEKIRRLTKKEPKLTAKGKRK